VTRCDYAWSIVSTGEWLQRSDVRVYNI